MRTGIGSWRSRGRSVAALAVLLLSATSAWAGSLNSNQLPTISLSMESALHSTWEFAPTIDMFAPAPGGGYQMTSSPSFNIMGGQVSVTINQLAFDPDPFVLNNILVTNNTNMTQSFSAFVGLATTFGAPNIISGTLTAGVIDGGFDGATLSTTAGFPIYSARIDGAEVAKMLDHPFSLSVGSGGSASVNTSFGPSVSNVPVTMNMGIQLRFDLSPGDTASILSRFDVVAVPAPAALSLLGIAAVCTRRRRRTA